MIAVICPDIHMDTSKLKAYGKILDHFRSREQEVLPIALMDLCDSHEKSFPPEKYKEVFEVMKSIAESHPQLLICLGNHEVNYMWREVHLPGYTEGAAYEVIRGIKSLERVLPAGHVAYCHQQDNVIFSHAGLTAEFCRRHAENVYNDVDETLKTINRLPLTAIWEPDSPIHFRALWEKTEMYKENEFLQVVGHCPIDRPTKKKNILFCDTREDSCAGSYSFVIVDTLTRMFRIVEA